MNLLTYITDQTLCGDFKGMQTDIAATFHRETKHLSECVSLKDTAELNGSLTRL